ncbi:hypothetical protein MU580_12885 [Clavibacter michiganensis subsp. michiganensis]|uniref:hypothetical protein n=1 Tax=Clavibacter michiganensis TaxID=28447 RepID=UPI001FF67791|nr:hypothetical protein [Clavibacter michiganensis]UOW03152.1 hypothetical protein MU580_12885 [Clavibacter michiganensis subsp. michiganensis]
MHKTKRFAILALVSAAVFTFSVATPAQANELTWFNGQAQASTKYTEGMVWVERTGTSAQFNDAVFEGTANIQVWIGDVSTDAWANSATIYGPHTFHKGAFRWRVPGETSSVNVSAKALGVNTAASSDAAAVDTAPSAAETDSAGPTARLKSLAAAEGFAAQDLNLVGTHEGVSLWKASNATDTSLYTSDGSEDGYITSARASNDSFARRAISVRTTTPGADGVNRTHQFVLTDDAHEADIAAVEGLSSVGDNAFVDTKVNDRAENELTTFGAGGAAQTHSFTDGDSSAAGYSIALSGGN